MGINFSDLKEDEIVLFVISAKKYLATNLDILRHYINQQKAYCIYLSVNRPYASIMKLFGKEKINTERLFVIDAITPVATDMERAGNAIFVGSPKVLTNISIAASSTIKSMPKEKRVLFLDSLSTLIIYNNQGDVTRFMHFLINKMREWNISGVLISLEKETDEKMLAQLTQFCDKVIEVK